MTAGSQSPLDQDSSRALYRDTVQKAAVAGSALMETLVNAARSVLHARESATKDLHVRDACIESARLLGEMKGAMVKAYPTALLTAFSGVRSSTTSELKSSSVQFDQLELMDELQVQSSVVAARAQHMALQAAEASLSELNSLVCGLLGLSTVRPDRNPLRPEMYVQALQDVLAQTEVPAATQIDWMGMMASPLGRELRTLYANLCDTLRLKGVVSATYSLSPSVLSQRAMNGGATHDTTHPFVADAVRPDPGGAATSAGAAPLTPSLTLVRLRQLLSGDLAQQPQGRVDRFNAEFSRKFEEGQSRPSDANPSGFDTTVPAALEALTEMKQVDQVVQKLEQRRARPADPATSDGNDVERVRVQLRAQARTPAQSLGLEVVSLMVDNMARDSRLLEPTQAFVRSMEPALLRLILVDPRFFTDKQHPARVLLHEVTHRSMAFQRVDAPEFVQFMGDVQAVVAPLQTADIQSAEVFDTAYRALTRQWADRAGQESPARAQAVEVLRHAEARNLLAEHLAREWEALPTASEVPGVVMDFLCGPWAQVVAQARIREGAGSVRAKNFETMVPDMLWSAQPMAGRESITRLTKLVPRLLATLREGLDTIQWPATRTSAFLEQLMAVHQKVFRTGADVNSQKADVATESEVGRLRWVEDGNPWIVPDEARSSNFLEVGEVTGAAPLQVDQEPLLQDMDLGQSCKEDVDRALLLGGWVEIQRNGEWSRTQLTWASPHNTLFLFTNSYGITQSMTRRTRDKLFEAGKLRLLTAKDVLDGALDAVAFTAMQNSVHSGFDESPGPMRDA